VSDKGKDRIVRGVLVAEVAQIDVEQCHVGFPTILGFRTALEIENTKGELLRLAVEAGIVGHSRQDGVDGFFHNGSITPFLKFLETDFDTFSK
jgi:hypothetical protein